MKRHYKIAIIAIILIYGYLLAIHQGFFEGKRNEAIINVIVISIVAGATFFKEKIPPRWSFRLGVLAALLCLASFGLYIVPHITTAPKTGQTETPKTGQTKTPRTLRQEMVDLLTDENFTKQMEEVSKGGRMPEYLSSVSKFQEHLVEQGLLEYKNIDLTNYYQNVFQKYYPGKAPSDLDTKMKQQLITTIQKLGYEKGQETFRNVPENVIWLVARFDPIQDMGETLGRWTDHVLADDFGDKTINEILGVPSRDPSPLDISPTEFIESHSDADSQNEISQEPLEIPQNDIIPEETAQETFHDKIEQTDIVDVDSTLQKLLTDQDLENPLDDFENVLREEFNPERFSAQRFNTAMQALKRYGSKEGLRRLKESDPEIATQIERLIQKEQEEN